MDLADIAQRAIIIAAGDGTRWGNYLDRPKHFIEIDGETILHRTVRLLNENGITDVHVVGGRDPRYLIAGSELYLPNLNPDNGGADKFLSTCGSQKAAPSSSTATSTSPTKPCEPSPPATTTTGYYSPAPTPHTSPDAPGANASPSRSTQATNSMAGKPTKPTAHSNSKPASPAKAKSATPPAGNTTAPWSAYPCSTGTNTGTATDSSESTT